MDPHTQGNRWTKAAAVIMVFILLACAHSTSAQKGRKQQEQDNRLTQLEVQSEVMSFADRLRETLSQALLELEDSLESTADLVYLERERLYTYSATTEIAAGSNPAIGLLDMAILVTLKRMTWEERSQSLYGEQAQGVVDAYRELERDIWSIVAKVYTPEQQQILREIIDEWRAANPDRYHVAFFRLSEFGDLRRVSRLLENAKPGGLLAPVRETGRQIEEARFLAERALFMLVRMQLSINDQIRLAMLETAAQPELQSLVGDTSTLAGAADRASVTFEDLAARLSSERQAAIDHLFEEIHAEREDLLADLTVEGSNARQTLAEFRVAAEAANTLAERVTSIVRESRAFYERTEEVAAAADDFRPFDILEYHQTFEAGTGMAKQLSEVIAGTERLLASDLGAQMPHLLEAVQRIGEEADKLAISSFSVGVGLIVAFFICLFLYRFAVVRWISPRGKTTQS